MVGKALHKHNISMPELPELALQLTGSATEGVSGHHQSCPMYQSGQQSLFSLHVFLQQQMLFHFPEEQPVDREGSVCKRKVSTSFNNYYITGREINSYKR